MIIKKFLTPLWNELKREPVPWFPMGILLVATITLTISHDHRIFSLVKSKVPQISSIEGIRGYDIYCFVVLFVIPSVYLKITGRKLRDFGLCWGRLELTLPLFLLLFLAMNLFGYLTSTMGVFKSYYGNFQTSNPKQIFLLFTTTFLFMWGLEFMHRGFLIEGLRKHVGKLSIFIQLMPFVILHLDKPPFELYGSIIFGLFFGWFAYITKSFIYLAFLHAYFATMICILL